MENEAAAIIAKSSPQQIATGELVVLKNTIKKFCKGPMRSELMKLANSELGALCSKISLSSEDHSPERTCQVQQSVKAKRRTTRNQKYRHLTRFNQTRTLTA